MELRDLGNELRTHSDHICYFNDCRFCFGTGHTHFDANRDTYMYCAYQAETGVCLWCLAFEMHLDLEPIYESYLKVLDQPKQIKQDMWYEIVQQHFADIMAPVNLKPAKSA